MSKYSRKVRGWGALGDYTEHKNKNGRVTSRTRYHEGKAITTRVPREPAYTKPGYQAKGYSPGIFDGALLNVFLVIGGLLLIAAAIGAVFSALNSALEGFWPIARVIACWLLAAGWAATVLHFSFATVERWGYRGWSFWLVTVAQIPLIAAGGFLAYTLVSTSAGAGPYSTQSEILGNALGVGVILMPILLVSLIVFAFRDSKLWLLAIPGAVLAFFVLTIAEVPYLGSLGVILVIYAMVMTRFSFGE